MKAYQDASLAPARRAKALLEEMTLAEKVGQLNQRLYGFRIYERKCVNGEDTIELSEEFRQEVEKYSGLGVLYGLYRADPWAGKDYETGLTGVLSKKAYNQVQLLCSGAFQTRYSCNDELGMPTWTSGAGRLSASGKPSGRSDL